MPWKGLGQTNARESTSAVSLDISLYPKDRAGQRPSEAEPDVCGRCVAVGPNRYKELSERKSIVVLTVGGLIGFLVQYTFKLAGGEIGIVIPQVGEQNLLSS